jgi:hypothetical protein
VTIPSPEGQRVEPPLPVTAMKSYQAISPRRKATCAETGCLNYLNGWRTVVDPARAAVVRSLTGYTWTENALEGGLTEFRFPAGQECLTGRAGRHSLPWDGRERFIERDGDWRGNPTGQRRELRPGDWTDSFANHQQRLADRLGRG